MEGFEYRNPYAAPAAQVPTAPIEHYDDGLVKAGRLPRLLAYLIDLGINLVLLAPAFIGILRFKPERGIGELGGSLIGLSVIAMLALMVYTLFLLAREGQTIGKRVIGIRIVRTDGERAGLLRLLGLRYFVPGLISGIPYLGAAFSLANILWIFGEERRCLHDHFADTMVVNV
ncbi:MULTISPECIES: RDD family protein [unclassified Lysobacter]|uniref:RDD family protein n=1 Tax=unclassified Lysobacter TaxID=2635362 RepID=UPI001C21A8E8|nr:RDD family protein [Lysobacter sp. MMG2]MBU8977016.1 RDD family protein [Lysobacter sp. MMG2]